MRRRYPSLPSRSEGVPNMSPVGVIGGSWVFSVTDRDVMRIGGPTCRQTARREGPLVPASELCLYLITRACRLSELSSNDVDSDSDTIFDTSDGLYG